MTESQGLIVETAAAETSDRAIQLEESGVERGIVDVTASAEDPLRAELRQFVLEQPGGWDHEAWLSLLNTLGERGYDVSKADAIGLALERERLLVILEGVPGVGERRRASILHRYARLWDLQHADEDELASLPGLNSGLAQRILEAVR